MCLQSGFSQQLGIHSNVYQTSRLSAKKKLGMDASGNTPRYLFRQKMTKSFFPLFELRGRVDHQQANDSLLQIPSIMLAARECFCPLSTPSCRQYMQTIRSRVPIRMPHLLNPSRDICPYPCPNTTSRAASLACTKDVLGFHARLGRLAEFVPNLGVNQRCYPPSSRGRELCVFVSVWLPTAYPTESVPNRPHITTGRCAKCRVRHPSFVRVR
ncbi:hypothetical protein B0T17DRAFT_409727 [Bombardia bombarda]|uniref:Uncharacterized protein n=1 Tax=Bombardia bombarda TaxID=252184 RepID=A0AA39TZE0_9PEZI|nr:hypothetical protein B0T17DRAFT_409727 [Bombardia bombarda]